MAIKNSKQPDRSGSTFIQLNLLGLVIFSVSLVVASGLLTFGLISWHDRRDAPIAQSRAVSAGKTSGGSVSSWQGETPPWGDLVTYNIELEKPDEYVAFESNTNRPPSWAFPGMQPLAVRALMLTCDFTPKQADYALAPVRATVTAASTVIHLDDELIFGLNPVVRAKLYDRLAVFAENHYIKNPFVFTTPDFNTIAARVRLDSSISNLVTRLLYPRGVAQCFSDIEFVLNHLPVEDDRLKLVKAMSSQSATLVRLQINPDTDVDKLLGYWAAPANGVRVKDVRPLLDSIKRLPSGANISLLYFLPQFARQRLYTFPMPAQVGDPMMDCHWSTMNFFNDPPDNRFNDPTYLGNHVKTNYYEIAKATAYGDVFFLQDEKGTVLHSAVYIADDIVFTKNGRSTVQPWILMHLKDLMGIYASSPGLVAKVYRNKNT